jgi:hypothetical protein
MAISRPSQLNAHFSDVLEVASILCIHRTMAPMVTVTERASFIYTRLLSSRTTSHGPHLRQIAHHYIRVSEHVPTVQSCRIIRVMDDHAGVPEMVTILFIQSSTVHTTLWSRGTVSSRPDLSAFSPAILQISLMSCSLFFSTLSLEDVSDEVVFGSVSGPSHQTKSSK